MNQRAQDYLGRVGVWSPIDTLSVDGLRDFARQLEGWGYGSLWVPEAVGRDPFATLAYLAGHTERLSFATGIANIYARDALTMKALHATLAGFLPQRFVLGLGVSHEMLVSQLRGHEYKKPIAAMRGFLEAMDKAVYMGPPPATPAPIVLAALRPAMLKLAGELTHGAHPYLVPVEHTRRAREQLGKSAWLCPEQKVLLERDPKKARAIARKVLEMYLGLPNYVRNLRDYGFDDGDFKDGGSDALVDALVAWGDESALHDRIEAHLAAGADHVCIQTLRADGQLGPDLALLERLAPGKH
ncbi:MAG: TIGR03620 family F420-dependent LLM class oxidoreductase [Polyangiales bacterium]